jgi:hypothetical protein
MYGGLPQVSSRGNMRKISCSPHAEFKGLQPLVVANYSRHLPSSLRGVVKSKINVASAEHYHSPEAISLHQPTKESFSRVRPTKNNLVNITRGCNPLEPQLNVRLAKPLHSELSARRLLRRCFTVNKTLTSSRVVSSLLAMTKGSNFDVRGDIVSNS